MSSNKRENADADAIVTVHMMAAKSLISPRWFVALSDCQSISMRFGDVAG